MAMSDPEHEADGDDYVEGMEEAQRHDPLVKLFGDHPKTRMLVALTDTPEPMNASDITRKAGLQQRQSWYRYKDDLLETGLVEKVGESGNADLYAIDQDDDRYEWLEKLADFTSEALREHDTDGADDS